MANLPKGRMRETDKVKGKDSPLPSEPGVYRHVNKKSGTIDYVGQTNDLRRRQQEHVRDGLLNTKKQKVAFSTNPKLSKDDLRRIEKQHIKRNEPRKNVTSGGNGRQA